jgi:hypothetical protein
VCEASTAAAVHADAICACIQGFQCLIGTSQDMDATTETLSAFRGRCLPNDQLCCAATYTDHHDAWKQNLHRSLHMVQSVSRDGSVRCSCRLQTCLHGPDMVQILMAPPCAWVATSRQPLMRWVYIKVHNMMAS